MSPRLVEGATCPHCDAELPARKPRVCPACGGSLQKRYLTCGCLSSAPAGVLLLAALLWLLG